MFVGADGRDIGHLKTPTSRQGERRAEVAGFQVRDLDSNRSIVHVERTAQRISGELVIGPPKSDRGFRSLPLPPALARRLADFIAARNLGPEDYVFGGSTPRDMASFYRRRFKSACKLAELGHVRIHDLRHTFASLMAHQDHKVHEVSGWLGHSTPSVTLDV